MIASVANLYSADPPSSAEILIFEDFSGGLNTQKEAHKLNLNQTPNAENGLIDEKPGSLIMRGGITLAGSTNTLSKVNFLGEFIKDNGDREMIVSDSSRVLTTRDFITFTLIKSTLTTTGVLRMAQGRNKALLTNGIDPAFYYDGTVTRFLDGTNGTPNIPRGKYPAFYQDRFWVLNTTASNSGLYFSALTSTDGFVIDPLVDSRAWPVTNQLNVGLGDGRAGSALDVFKGQLQVHKDNSSIYTIFGNDEFEYFPRKTNAHSGTISHDAIAQSDNLEYYPERGGVAAFDGGDSLRISDDIFPDMEAVASNLTTIVDNTWDSRLQFESRGYMFNSSATADNFLILQGTYMANTYNPDSVPLISDISASSTTGWSTLAAAQSNANWSGTLNFSSITIRFTGGGYTVDENSIVTLSFLNRRTNIIASTTSLITGNTGVRSLSFFYNDFNITSQDIRTSQIAVKTSIGNCGSGCSGIDLSSITSSGGGNIFLTTDTANYVSEISTISTITFWDTFESLYNTNGGNISFYLKAATSVVSIATVPWTLFVPGGLIDFPTTRNYIQWSATMSAKNIAISTAVYIDRVSINHNEGGSSDTRPIGIEWEKRYWLAVTTTPSGTSTIFYVKSKITNSNPNAWMKFTGINIRSLSKFGDNLYGGSSNSGEIYRLDYGTNDNGTPINWFYETPDVDMGAAFFRKQQYQYFLDMDKATGGTLSLATSVDGGAFSTKSIDIDGTGRLLKTVNDVPKYGFTYRYKFSNNQLDKAISFHGFGVLFDKTKVRPN